MVCYVMNLLSTFWPLSIDCQWWLASLIIQLMKLNVSFFSIWIWKRVLSLEKKDQSSDWILLEATQKKQSCNQFTNEISTKAAYWFLFLLLLCACKFGIKNSAEVAVLCDVFGANDLIGNLIICCLFFFLLFLLSSPNPKTLKWKWK